MLELGKLVPIILKVVASGAKAPLQRNSTLIKALKSAGWNPEHPPADFSSIYAHALVEYALGGEAVKTEPLVKLFGEPEIKQAFRTAFGQGDLMPLVEALDGRLNWQDGDAEWNFAAQAIRDESINIQQEVDSFQQMFLQVVELSETPKERYQTLLLTELQQRLNEIELKPAPVEEQQRCAARNLAEQLDGWFKSLKYGREAYECIEAEYCEWIITVPARRGFDRILVRCIEGEARLSHIQDLQTSFEHHTLDEGWLVSTRRISSAVKERVKDSSYQKLYCYTLDDVIDQVADFGKYLEWLEAEITERGIDTDYMPLGCSKEEIDPGTKALLGVSHYGEAEGWIEGYVDQWVADSSKEHLSVLGEFGTGKTWFVMHYAWLALQAYKAAKAKGVERPRLPLVIPLRDYAKEVSMESLFSEFFFRKHEIPLPGYTAFEQLNKMGKLLLIFDGFDEMAARVDLQAMIDNFWELARVVVPGAKAILTCRTEHFPDAIEGRATLSAERKASTANLTGEPPQFEVLELAKFDDGQIAELLWRKVQRIAAAEGREPSQAAVKAVMNNPQLLDLARRPVMVDLILEALPEIEKGKRVDMARVYLYAMIHKMETDIKNERTFTSLADKLYFLCELAWEMISTNQMSLNYRAFPARLQQMFAARVQEEKELDHWRYDMMGQTMLIRNSEGDYSPAHRSLLEFFVAYKIVASLGAIAPDFTTVAQGQSHVNEALPSSLSER
ncbi:MAG: NTPase (NACHT family) [Phormidesmis priestleyi]|uniref:NTPase (NACHT family) n=1 Tax=Phormidesmis priestleyi TaxID=268141 RepID=A0A2W4WWB0_9CYAN|nr:MAG: NTPase (NACHT family) [Phormidesmis priestleyi]